MTKRVISLMLTLVLALSLICIPVQASEQNYGGIPILIGYADADYMAEQVLSEIPIPTGGSDWAIIQSVYDWVIRNCSRDSWNGITYFDESTLYDQATIYANDTNARIAAGQAVIRPTLTSNYSVGTWDASYDSNYYIAVFAYEMMMYRTGNCAHYSALLALLLNHLGYDCRLIGGEFINGDGSKVEHKWNYVLVDGQYYWLDVRMDHAIYARTGVITHEYFMVSSTSEWSEDHTWDRTYSNGLAKDAASIQAYYDSIEHTHQLTFVPGTKATCTEAGQKSYYECSVCGKFFLDVQCKSEISPSDVTLPALGHDWGSWTVVQECTMEADGIRQRFCSNDASHVETETFNDLATPFADVARDAYYFRPVLWAVEQGITAGTGTYTFSPDDSCTRAQVVTFLWRSAGSPAPSGSASPFTDVQPGSYYYNAVLWAVEQGITSGTGADTFSPNDICTRGQVVTFLWRFAGSPTVYSASNPFGDVSGSDYYYAAVRWAVKNGITSGVSNTRFAPNDQCTRGQVVTFLYRANS